MTDIHRDKILILDFGAQYTQLIARRIREIGVYCEIWAWDHDPAEVAAWGAKGIILSGGPESTTEAGAPFARQSVFDANKPLLGVCYGMQTMAKQLGGATEGGRCAVRYATVPVTITAYTDDHQPGWVEGHLPGGEDEFADTDGLRVGADGGRGVIGVDAFFVHYLLSTVLVSHRPDRSQKTCQVY